MAFWATVTNAVVGLLGGCIGAFFTLWVQSRKEWIQPFDQDKLRVHYNAIKSDENGLYIPGYGRIINISQTVSTDKDSVKKPSKKDLLIMTKGQKKVAFICHERTAGSSSCPQYVIGKTVPM